MPGILFGSRENKMRFQTSLRAFAALLGLLTLFHLVYKRGDLPPTDVTQEDTTYFSNAKPNVHRKQSVALKIELTDSSSDNKAINVDTFTMNLDRNPAKKPSCSTEYVRHLLNIPRSSFARGGTLSGSKNNSGIDDSNLRQMMSRRSRKIRWYCDKLKLDPTKRMERIKDATLFIDQRNKYIFCPHGKVANTVWYTLFLSMTGYLAPNDTALTDPDLFWKKHFNRIVNEMKVVKDKAAFVSTREYKLAPETLDRIVREGNHRRWLVVRHPFEILASVYRNKVVEEKNFLRPHITKLRKPGKKYEEIPSFSEFADFMVRLMAGGGVVAHDYHWETYLKTCAPCDIDYEYVAHYENLRVEADYILREVAAPVKHFPQSSSSRYAKDPRDSASLALSYFRSLSDAQICALGHTYHDDFYMFDYYL